MGSIICLILLLNKEDWGEGWLCQALFGSLFIALECAIYYFLLKGLAYVLGILMEMEFTSRLDSTKNNLRFLTEKSIKI